MNQEESNQKILKQINEKWQFDRNIFLEHIYNVDMEIKNYNGLTPIMFILENNKNKNINLSAEEIEKLINKSNLNTLSNEIMNISMYLMVYNEREGIHIKPEKIKKIIQKSNRNIKNYFGWTWLNILLFNNEKQKIDCSKKEIKDIYNELDEDNQQQTFKTLIKEYYDKINDDDHEVIIKNIDFLLYDCKFEPNEELKKYLLQNDEEIIKKIEKRDLLFNLNNGLSKEQKIEKVLKV